MGTEAPDPIILSVAFGDGTEPRVDIAYAYPDRQGRRVNTQLLTSLDKALVPTELDDVIDTLRQMLNIALVDERLNREP